MSKCKYSYEFKKKCVELYRQNLELPTPDAVSRNNFRHTVAYWTRLVEANGFEVLKPRFKKHRYWDPVEELCMVNQVLTGKTMSQVAIENGLLEGQLRRWVRIYETEGYSGLVNHTRKKPVKEPCMNSKNMKNVDPLTMSEREELKFLREENERIRTEVEVLKKFSALRRAKQAALLKAKKQKLSKNSVSKDIN